MHDLIDRQMAIDILDAYQVMVENGEENPYTWARFRMSELPSAQQDCTECPEYDTERHYCPKYCDVIKQTLEEAKQERTGRWIPCSERLPEDGERVLATHLGGLNPDRQVIEHIYKNGEFTLGWDMDMNMDSPTFGQRYMGKVVAWMPLPEPYREDGEAE